MTIGGRRPAAYLRWLAIAVPLIVAPIPAASADAQAGARRSGFEFMGTATQAMQRDDAQNPAMLWVAEGEAAWRRTEGGADRSCADCHGDARTSMRGVAARYPSIGAASGRPVTLAQRIASCRVERQRASAWAPESEPLVSLEAYVALQSRGLPIAPPADARLAAARARGESLFHRRVGALDLACAQCHDDLAGRKLGGSTIPQAHPTGYPVYRLEWQSVGTLERRIRGCYAGVRARPPAYGAPDLVDLQVYLAARAAGMPLESPGVRP
jgi:sulfur-oxidizing protein SoxA